MSSNPMRIQSSSIIRKSAAVADRVDIEEILGAGSDEECSKDDTQADADWSHWKVQSKLERIDKVNTKLISYAIFFKIIFWSFFSY